MFSTVVMDRSQDGDYGPAYDEMPDSGEATLPPDAPPDSAYQAAALFMYNNDHLPELSPYVAPEDVSPQERDDEPPPNWYIPGVTLDIWRCVFVPPERVRPEGPVEPNVLYDYRIPAVGSEFNPLVFTANNMYNITFVRSDDVHVVFENVNWINVNDKLNTAGSTRRIGGVAYGSSKHSESNVVVRAFGDEIHPIIFYKQTFYRCTIDCNDKCLVFINCTFYGGIHLVRSEKVVVVRPTVLPATERKNMDLFIDFTVYMNGKYYEGEVRAVYEVAKRETPLEKAKRVSVVTAAKVSTQSKTVAAKVSAQSKTVAKRLLERLRTKPLKTQGEAAGANGKPNEVEERRAARME